MDMLVIDRKGEWFVNTGAFPFTDPTSGVTFTPGRPTCVNPTPWMKGQPVLQPWVDSEDEDATKTPAPPATPAPKAKA